MSQPFDRRTFLGLATAAGLPIALADQLWADVVPPAANAPEAVLALRALTKEQLAAAEAVLGISFTDAEREMMLSTVDGTLASLAKLQQVPLPNSVVPALHFDPRPAGATAVGQPITARVPLRRPNPLVLPTTDSDWAFASAEQLGRLIRAGHVTSRQLVDRALARYAQFDPILKCAITLTPERARAQADALDAEAKRGSFRGPLHGVPYAAKDLFAVPGYPTTWGSPLFKEQRLEETAAVVERLDKAGAVLVAKTSLGEFAQGDVWFGGMTRNPWNTEQGSSGSSAGSASSVAAGLVPFAIGTETLGSIVSPCTRCGVSGLRPTFGRISRHGAMALSWTMDKVGPIARHAGDLALVFDAVHGADPRDPSTRTMPFRYEPDRSLANVRIGVHPSLVEPAADASAPQRAAYTAQRPVLDALIKAGATLTPIIWPETLPTDAMRTILTVEAAAAFEEITRTNRDDQMVQQNRGAWPNTFRAAHMVSAVQYVQANRARTLLMQQLATLYATVDVIIAPTNAGSVLTATNLSGHPTVVVPSGFSEQGAPRAITFVAALWREDLALRLAAAWQQASDIHLRRPPKFS
ncbi:MAG: amidase [Gemmatimonadetes bacterium]|nr:amidase [Gemmatimonadota bacterium]